MRAADIARMIPAEYRDRILDSNAIFKAIAIPSDPHMTMLFIIWTEYVDTVEKKDPTCTSCLGEILQNFKHLQPALIEARKADHLLDL